MNCPVCNGNKNVILRSLYDDRYAYPGLFRLLQCTDCKHIYLEHDFTDLEIESLYTKYYPRSALNLEQHKPHVASSSIRSWFNGEKASAFRWVPEDVTILDIGCGFGESLGFHKKRGCDVYGIEADENIARVANKYGYKADVGLFSAALYEENFFDYVTLDQVIEHFVDPKKTIHGVCKILKPGGYAILSTPNVEGWGARVFGQRWVHWHAPYHLHHFSKKSIEKIVENEGLILKRIYTITNSEWLYYQWLHLLMYPTAGNASGFWQPSIKKSKLQRNVFRIIVWTHKMKINHILTRFFDLLNLGDNRVYIFKKI